MNLKRINAGACRAPHDENYIYVFGGRSDGDEIYDSIERYNIELDCWNMLEIRLPKKLCNMFVFPFENGNQDNFIVMGGLKPRELTAIEQIQGGGTRFGSGSGVSLQTENERNVYMFNR
jgi:hypothetical protein